MIMLTRAAVEEVLSQAVRIEFDNGSRICLQDGLWHLFRKDGEGLEAAETLGALLAKIAEKHAYE